MKPGRDHNVFKAQIDHLYQQLPRLLAYSLLVSLALSVMLRNAVPASHVIGWFSTMLIFLLLRLLLFLLHRKNTRNNSTRYWSRLYVLFAGISGLIWGSAGVVLFAPAELELQALILLVLAGMGAGSASVLPMYLPAFYAYLPASMIPSGVMMLLQRDNFHVFMGIFDFIFLFGVLAFGRAIGDAFQSSLKLRFENIDLVAELERQKAELERANLAKSKFLAAASHDLRQPMHALSLFSELLEHDAPDQRTRELAIHINGSVTVLERLFSALLDISRIDAGVLKPDMEIFPLRRVVDRVFSDSLPVAEEKGLLLHVEYCDDFTESDPTLLERILRNLVTNSIRYTESGQVTIRCQSDAQHVLLSVEDTGVGIAADQQEYIFEEFTQLENPERDRSKGLGLGLSIVRRLAELLEHPLELESHAGRGARFSLTLPLRSAPQQTAANPHPGEPEVSTRLRLAVLVIDDDQDILEGTRQLLESWGCEVLCAATAEAALEIAQGEQPLDALVTDFRLPEHARGTQLVASIRQIRNRQIPALLITGDMEPARLQEAQSLDLELLHKPVRPARLRAWLQKIHSI